MGAVHDNAQELWRKALARLPSDVHEIDPGDYEGDERLIAELACGVMDMTDCYDGAMEDCESAVMVLIRRIKGEGTMEGAAEWVRSNYPKLAREHGLRLSDKGRA